mmetsp:Transcript_28054/g.46453  ORF Transcript_28054/g.46453 Transcript_28054/m.46453 type:complete len:328 (+) Transcript_28054:214-1197(+)|eukprot:CAMPEP_0119003072 /NCGR_PEP_ID=MMETSP1176-20130426/338_1 /TAXON_ID=265551 /ORGANISM="Synedropsis recta cf, Strain CCMP1620" /LENGTH=327 /DNA_ID=CAMNT_0006954633 /DNA_START=307 /DNA_END=1290 /DNA_ORIENTATION=+
MSDAQYRRDLELELERLTKELADVRVEKAQQRQRIENLQLEQTQLKDQLGNKTAGDKELRTDLAQQLHTLHQVVRQKKGEHCKVKQEWERSQEQYTQLKQTVGLLQGSSILDENSLQGDDLDQQTTQSKDAVQSMMGSMVIEHASLMSGLKDEQYNSNDSSNFGRNSNNQHNVDSEAKLNDWEEEDDANTIDTGSVMTEHTKDSLMVHRRKQLRKSSSSVLGGDEGDNDTVITEHTKDSLMVHRSKQMKDKGAASSNSSSGLGKFFSKQEASRSSNNAPAAARTSGGAGGADPSASISGRSKLGTFLDKERKKPAKVPEKDVKSACE